MAVRVRNQEELVNTREKKKDIPPEIQRIAKTSILKLISERTAETFAKMSEKIQMQKLMRQIYYEDNKARILEKVREYQRENKERINERQAEKIECDRCGSKVSRRCLYRHWKSMKCENGSVEIEIEE